VQVGIGICGNFLLDSFNLTSRFSSRGVWRYSSVLNRMFHISFSINRLHITSENKFSSSTVPYLRITVHQQARP